MKVFKRKRKSTFMNTAVKDLMIKRFPPGPRGRRRPEHFDAPGSIGNKLKSGKAGVSILL